MSDTSIDKNPVSEKVEDNRLESGPKLESDGEDHEHEPPMTIHRFLSLVAMAFLWTGSQIPVYLLGAVPPYIYREIGGTDRWIWFVLANLLALASICPFVGSLSDLMGRRYVALMGAMFLVVGMIVCGTAHTMNTFIGGMAISGIGAGINELTALAATSELAPTRKRGTYVGILVLTIVPFCPSVLWGQLIAYHATWRWCAWISCIWAGIGGVLTFIFYHPPPRPNSLGLTKMEIIKRIDDIGGFLSISGLLLFNMGLQWGGYQYKWHTAHVLVPLILGAFLLVAFAVWEVKGAKYPIFPSGLKKEPRILALTLIITFISGANFFSVLMFWPTQAFNVYGHNPWGVGARGMPIGFSILTGAVVVLCALSYFRGYNRELLTISSIIMTAGCGSMAIANQDNMTTVFGLLVLAGFGIGGIILPASIITTIICPDDLIATVTALTLAIRVVGGSIGYTVYYNVFIAKFVPNAIKYIGATCYAYNITDPAVIGEIIGLTGASLIDEIRDIPGVNSDAAWSNIVNAGQFAYAESYKYVYFVSIAFGAISIIASVCMKNINYLMTDHVAVVIH